MCGCLHHWVQQHGHSEPQHDHLERCLQNLRALGDVDVPEVCERGWIPRRGDLLLLLVALLTSTAVWSSWLPELAPTHDREAPPCVLLELGMLQLAEHQLNSRPICRVSGSEQRPATLRLLGMKDIVS
jgi:hypothetical protein